MTVPGNSSTHLSHMGSLSFSSGGRKTICVNAEVTSPYSDDHIVNLSHPRILLVYVPSFTP